MERRRLLSLDVFRGLTIAGMILVNNPGTWSKIYPPLQHAEWHGWTPTDLIFPFFLFIVGVSITFSQPTVGRIVRRAILIFACGLFLNWFWKWSEPVRIPGVLQRIAVCYLVAALLTKKFEWRGIAGWAVFFLVAYWAILLFGPLDKGKALPCVVDVNVFGKHAYKPDHDPEGLLSTIPAISTTLLGVLTGMWLRLRRPPQETAVWMFVAGCFLAVVGYVWSAWLPINKPLWTSSYVLLTGGFALLFLGFCYWIIDGVGWSTWSKPFEVYGMNALAVFMASGMLARAMKSVKPDVYRTFISVFGDNRTASLSYALANVLFWLGILWILYWRKIFIKL